MRRAGWGWVELLGLGIFALCQENQSGGNLGNRAHLLFFFFYLTFTICTSKSREEVVTKPLSLLAWWGSGVSELRQWLLHLRCFHYALGSMGRIQEAWFPSCPKVLWTTLKRCPKLQKTWLHKMVAALKVHFHHGTNSCHNPNQNRFITKALSKL